MTLLLKSKNRSSGSVGNVHGNLGPSDYVAMLDFARGEYFTNLAGVRKDYLVDQVVSVTRNSVGSYLDEFGVWRSSPASTPRVHRMQDLGVAGLLLEDARANYAASAANGATVTIPGANAATAIMLSYYGTGDVSLTSASLTLQTSYVVAGRTVKEYGRSGSLAISATLAVTGEVTRVQCEQDNAHGNRPWRYASSFIEPGASRDAEVCELKDPIVALLAGGKGSVVLREILMPWNFNGPTLQQRVIPATLQFNNKTTLGGIIATRSAYSTQVGTDDVNSSLDGPPSAYVRRTGLNGNLARSTVQGLMFNGNGADVGIISYGQVNIATGTGVTFSTPNRIAIGTHGGIITHAIVYDRMLSAPEAQIIANQWLN